MSTIAAIATPQSAAGIGIVRISGEDAVKIADSIFKGISGTPLCEKSGYQALFGKIYDGEVPVDEAVALVFRAPKSYTGEDVVELSTHGGLYIMKRVLRAAFSAGAVPAQPGEFTKRAFLNGKLDLSEAEAVMSLISSSGEEARAATFGVLSGTLSREIYECRDILANRSAFLSAWVDYPDDEIPELSDDELYSAVEGVRARLCSLLDGFDKGRAVIEGVNTVIVGRPNVGKSTLLNALSGYEKAIVTSVAGTTRDVLEETVKIGNVTLRLADTAGIRNITSDEIEKIGILRARERLQSAELVLCMLSADEPLTEDDIDLIKACSQKRCIAVINKTDLERKLTADTVREYIDTVVEISAKDRGGLESLKDTIEKTVGTDGFDSSAPLLTSERQRLCTEKAVECLSEALDGIKSGITPDAVNVSIDCAIESLSTLTGEKATETVVDEVFKNFCVGK